MGFAKPAQIGFVEIRQRTDGLERLICGDIKIVGRLVAENDGDPAATLDLAVNGAVQRAGQVEVRSE